jgi:CheY-like chemotaxis protein
MLRVLIVDDDHLLLATLEAMLIDEGFDVVTTDGGQKAVTLVQQVSFDVILVDMVMPGMDGFATIRECRRLKPDLPIVAMSGYMFQETVGGTPNHSAMAVRLTGMRVLHKPFDQDKLGAALRAATSKTPH